MKKLINEFLIFCCAVFTVYVGVFSGAFWLGTRSVPAPAPYPVPHKQYVPVTNVVVTVDQQFWTVKTFPEATNAEGYVIARIIDGRLDLTNAPVLKPQTLFADRIELAPPQVAIRSITNYVGGYDEKGYYWEPLGRPELREYLKQSGSSKGIVVGTPAPRTELDSLRQSLDALTEQVRKLNERQNWVPYTADPMPFHGYTLSNIITVPGYIQMTNLFRTP